MKNLLTKREKEIFNYLDKGYTTNEVANILKIKAKTIRNHISNVIMKLGVKTRKDVLDILNSDDKFL